MRSAQLFPAVLLFFAALACKTAPKGREQLAAEEYEKTACACASSACVREAQRQFHEASQGQLGSNPGIGKVLSRAMGCAARFVGGACAGPGPSGCAPGFSCLPAVGTPPGTVPGHTCWRD